MPCPLRRRDGAARGFRDYRAPDSGLSSTLPWNTTPSLRVISEISLSASRPDIFTLPLSAFNWPQMMEMVAFARAVYAEKGKQLAGTDVKGQVADGSDAAEGFIKMRYFDYMPPIETSLFFAPFRR